MKKLTTIVVMFVMFFGIGIGPTGCGEAPQPAASDTKLAVPETKSPDTGTEPLGAERTEIPSTDAGVQYTCTMHPEVVMDTSGKCPKCGMDLVVKKLVVKK